MNFKIFIWCVLLKLVVCEENTVSLKLQDNNPLGFKTTTDFFKLTTSLANRSHEEPITLANRVEKQNEVKLVLGYKPTRPSYLPEPITVPQLIPPGTPWPAAPEDYVTKHNKTQVIVESITLTNRIDESKKETKLEYKPTRPSFLPEPSTVQQLIPTGKPWPSALPENYITKNNKTQVTLESITLANRIEGKNETNLILEYKPTRPSFLPELSTVQQLIPPGKPWPASPEDYNIGKNNKTQVVLESVTLANRIDENESDKVVLENKPTRPSFIPEPSTVQQLISPGKPWPASHEEHVTKSTLSPHLINRFPELTSTSVRPSTFSTRIVLTYKPQRPWYLPEPTYIGQIIPPGKPWPASLEEYASFSQTTYRPNRFEKAEHDETVK
ncbi:hypothetical protein RN001_013462 [Aquatica leii]|uniref:Uncharacterized protein n=1 Tax=Aquatica leii TaxID=1421715 RepID=A0AAN7PRS9_9COLE|nr:hypothetical protein RN001_013462 [Aquatica leii]